MDETVIKRVMPHNGEAEEAVIGSMLLDQDAVVLASEKLKDVYKRQTPMLPVTKEYPMPKPTIII